MKTEEKVETEEKGITEVAGVYALGKTIGIKSSGKKDLAVLFSESICNGAAVYTKNRVKGAPLIVTKDHLKGGKAQAIVVTSGVANVCTGKKGIEDAKNVAKAAAKELGINEKNVLIASTGLIGAFLPVQKIEHGLKGIKKELVKKSEDAASAILTTDKKIKMASVKVGNITIGAIAKGSGMIHPNMATMLCFIFTDADFSPSKLHSMLLKAVNESFNMISIDMDTSTSDMAILLANGKKGKIPEDKFQEGLNAVCASLAKKVAIDGEGATKLIEVNVVNAKTKEDAKCLAKAVISSNLVKAACFGNDPNWGRIMAAMGNSNASFSPEKADIYMQEDILVENGLAVGFDKKKIKEDMKKEKLDIKIDLKEGKESATAWGCDLTYDYVRENAEYTT